MATDSSLYVGPPSAPDRYRLRRSIGRGGEAVLYLAEIELSGEIEPVVVKVLDAGTAMTTAQFSRTSAKWNDQAELLRFVHRLGVVGVREHFEGAPPHPRDAAEESSGQTLCLVMNHVDGLDLGDWRAERALETPAERREAVRCLEQVAEVLDWLHSGQATPSGRTVVHGDLSPGNVMVNDDGQATLVDFGLSKLTADHRTAEVWFTPGYAAPEVFDGTRSPATDRYAFGAIAYFLLSGEAPPSAPEQLRERFRALAYVAELPEEQVARLLALFAAEPQSRPESLSAWMKDLRRTVMSTTTSRGTDAAATGGAVGAAAAMTAPAGVGNGQWPSAPPLHPPTQPAAAGAAAPDASRPPGGPRRRNRTLTATLAAGAVVLVVAGALLGSSLADGGGESSARPSTDVATAPAAGADDAHGGEPTETPSQSANTSASPHVSASPSDNSRTGGDTPESTPLTSLEPVDENTDFQQQAAVVNTREYADALVASPRCGPESAAYNLGRSWTSLLFNAGVTDTSDTDPLKLTVTADGDTVLSKTLVLGRTEKIDLDVSGVLRLRIEINSADESCIGGDVTGILGGPVLTK